MLVLLWSSEVVNTYLRLSPNVVVTESKSHRDRRVMFVLNSGLAGCSRRPTFLKCTNVLGMSTRTPVPAIPTEEGK